MDLVKRPDNQYVDLFLYNSPDINPTEAIPATITKQYNQPIIDRPSDYYMWVEKLIVPLYEIPIFTFVTVSPTSLVSKYYSITLSYEGVDKQVYLNYMPRNDVPLNRSVISYQAFVDMVNVAFASALTMLAIPGSPTPPFMMYTNTNNLISIACRTDLYQDTLVNPIKIYMNFSLYELFQSLQNFVNANPANQIKGKDVQIIVHDNGNNQLYLPATAPTTQLGLNYSTINPSLPLGFTYLLMSQEYSSLYNWNDLNSIVLTSDTMGSRPSYLPNANDIANSTITTNTQNILNDFNPIPTIGTEDRSTLVYNAVNRRYIDLTGSNPIYNFNIKIYWTDQLNQFHQLLLTPGKSISIKLGFIRKGSPYLSLLQINEDYDEIEKQRKFK